MNEYSEEQKKRIKEAFLKSLNNGVTLDKAAESAGVTRATIWNWRNIDEEFNNAINETINSRTQTMEDALFQSGVKGNVVAQIFWLKNRSKGRWKDKQEIEHSGKIELNKEETNELIDLAERAIEQLKSNDKGSEKSD